MNYNIAFIKAFRTSTGLFRELATFYSKALTIKLQTLSLWTKTTKVVRWFLLTNRQLQEVGHCRRHIFGPIIPKFYVEFENGTSSCDNLRPCRT